MKGDYRGPVDQHWLNQLGLNVNAMAWGPYKDWFLRLIPVVSAAIEVDKAEQGYQTGELWYPEYTTALARAIEGLHEALQAKPE